MKTMKLEQLVCIPNFPSIAFSVALDCRVSVPTAFPVICLNSTGKSFDGRFCSSLSRCIILSSAGYFSLHSRQVVI